MTSSTQRTRIDEKIPRHLRDRIPLVAKGQEILVIGNFAISETIRATETTRYYHTIHFTREES